MIRHLRLPVALALFLLAASLAHAFSGGARGSRSDLFLGSRQYKLNAFFTFAYEQGYYRTRAANRAGALPLFRGIPSYATHNVRSEFATIFTF